MLGLGEGPDLVLSAPGDEGGLSRPAADDALHNPELHRAGEDDEKFVLAMVHMARDVRPGRPGAVHKVQPAVRVERGQHRMTGDRRGRKSIEAEEVASHDLLQGGWRPRDRVHGFLPV